jgi:hypothetical protein
MPMATNRTSTGVSRQCRDLEQEKIHVSGVSATKATGIDPPSVGVDPGDFTEFVVCGGGPGLCVAHEGGRIGGHRQRGSARHSRARRQRRAFNGGPCTRSSVTGVCEPVKFCESLVGVSQTRLCSSGGGRCGGGSRRVGLFRLLYPSGS